MCRLRGKEASRKLVKSTFQRLSFHVWNLGHLLRPFSVGYIKGYKRCSVLLIILQGVRELGLEDQIPHTIRVAWLSILNTEAFELHGEAHMYVLYSAGFDGNYPCELWCLQGCAPPSVDE